MLFLIVFSVILVVIIVLYKDYIYKLLFNTTSNDNCIEKEPLISSTDNTKNNNIKWSNILTLFVNGKQIEIVNPDPTTLLSNYIRNDLQLTGTKLGCEEGGCGACTVVLTNADGVVSVNSCLRPLCANDGMAITTVEGIGSVNTGLSEEQQRLVVNNGTQCGYCTPGWITNMHALNESAAKSGVTFTKRQVEAYLDGNICRCTGYRPIVKAFQTFATDGPAVDAKVKSNVCIERNCTKEQQQACHTSGHCCTSSNSPTPADLEDMGCSSNKQCNTVSVFSNNTVACRDRSLVDSYVPRPLQFFNPVTGKKWLRPVNLRQLCTVLRESVTANKKVQLVGGNTSIGVSKYLNGTAPYYTADEYDTLIDVNSVTIMTTQHYNENTRELTVGAATTLSNLISLLRSYAMKPSAASASGTNSVSSSESGEPINHHSIFSVTANHLTQIANTQVRNAGSWAGNLMVFMRYHSFPSDAVLALTTADAQLQLCNMDGKITTISMDTFLTYTIQDFEAQGLMIVALIIKESPHMSVSRFFSETFKIAQRTKNAHAHVNAGFQFEVRQSPQNIAPVCVNARIVYGGVSNVVFVAQNAQNVLRNKPINANTLQAALIALQNDLLKAGKSQSPLGSQAFRESVMQSCLYRSLLRCYPVHALPPSVLSAVQPWVKPVSRGVEVFLPPTGSEARQNTNPVGKPVRKLEAPIQATGQATYPSDETIPSRGLHAAVVFSTQCATRLLAIDTQRVMKMDGVLNVLTAADIPGTNEASTGVSVFVPLGEVVPCVGAPLAVVVATSETIANSAVTMVDVTYDSSGVPPPLTNITQAVQQQSFFDVPKFYSHLTAGQPHQAMQAAANRSRGHINAGGQYHFYMEAQSAVASMEDGDNITVTCGTQAPSAYQSKIAAALNIPQNKVIIKCTRTGGGFGGKLTGGISNATIAAVCASKLGRPVRIFNLRTADMNMHGGREEWMIDYEVGYDDSGKVSALTYKFFLDGGSASIEALNSVYMGMQWADNAYFFANYEANAKLCYTNTPFRTSMRAPGTVQSCLATEMVIDRVATELGLPMTSVQERNFIQDGEAAICGQIITDSTLSTVWNTLLERSRYNDRFNKVNVYNQNNLWRKRGIAICPVKYGMGWARSGAGVRIGIRNSDGTVTLSHNGCEIGQGINTKAAQAVAMALGIDISLVRVTSTGTDKVVNGGATVSSGTSELVVQAALNACQDLNARLDPYRSPQTLNKFSATRSVAGGIGMSNSFARGNNSDHMSTNEWLRLVQSLPPEVSLNAEGWYSPSSNPNGQPFQYFVYAACVSEIELDVLSGEVHVLAAEMVYDCGQSLNPAVDIGQIEGAFVMGMGYFLSEKVEYDSTTGELLTPGTWEYKPPMVQDIPSVMNVTLLKNMYNQSGILGSKAVGEPPYIISNSVYFAVKMAVASARADAGVPPRSYFSMQVPATVDVRQLSSLVNPRRFVMPC